MKKVLFLVLAILIGINCSFAQSKLQIGKMSGKNYQTTRIKEVKNYFAHIMEIEGFDEALSSITIQRIVNEESNEEKFIILGTNSSNSFKIGIEVFLDEDNGFYITPQSLANRTVTCNGCTMGCSVANGQFGWYCKNSCGPKCSKSETVVTKLLESNDPVQSFIADYQ